MGLGVSLHNFTRQSRGGIAIRLHLMQRK